MSERIVTGATRVALPPLIGQAAIGGSGSEPAAAAFDRVFAAALLKECSFLGAGTAGTGEIWNDMVRELLAGQIAEGQALGVGRSLLGAQARGTTGEGGHDR